MNHKTCILGWIFWTSADVMYLFASICSTYVLHFPWEGNKKQGTLTDIKVLNSWQTSIIIPPSDHHEFNTPAGIHLIVVITRIPRNIKWPKWEPFIMPSSPFLRLLHFISTAKPDTHCPCVSLNFLCLEKLFHHLVIPLAFLWMLLFIQELQKRFCRPSLLQIKEVEQEEADTSGIYIFFIILAENLLDPAADESSPPSVAPFMSWCTVRSPLNQNHTLLCRPMNE